MASNDGQATFRINVEGNAATSTKDVASSARLAAKAIAAYEDEIKELSGDLRRIKGNSDEINEAKATLKKRIDAAKGSVSQLTVELTKQGQSYKSATAALSKYGTGVTKLTQLRAGASKTVGALGAALSPLASKVGGALAPVGKRIGSVLAPVGARLSAVFKPLAAKLGTMLAPVGAMLGKAFAPVGRLLLKGIGGAFRALGPVVKAGGSMLSSVFAAVGPLLASGVGAAVALAAAIGAAGVAIFGLAAHSADASARQERMRTAILGNAGDAKRLGDQVDVLSGKVALSRDELNGMANELAKTRLTGKGMVSTMNAVAQVTSAIDASAGSKIQELITRGQNMGRFQLQPAMQGMADDLQGTGLAFEDVASAYAEVTKKGMAQAATELRSGVAPIESASAAVALAAEKKFGKLNIQNAFSLSNAPGKFMEQFGVLAKGMKPGIDAVGEALAKAFGQLSPDAPLGGAIKTFFDLVGNDMLDTIAKTIPALLEGFKFAVAGALRMAASFYKTKADILAAWNAGDFIGMGKAIMLGILKGLALAGPAVVEGVIGAAKSIKDSFTGKGGIDAHSPSKAFEKFGKWSIEGYAQGVERSMGRSTDAVQAAAQPPDGGGATAARAGASIGTIEVHINGAPTDAKGMQEPAFLASLTRALRDAVALQGAG